MELSLRSATLVAGTGYIIMFFVLTFNHLPVVICGLAKKVNAGLTAK